MLKKIILRILLFFVISYCILCGIFYFIQESIIFVPEKLSKKYDFEFTENFEELNFKVEKDISLNGLLFKSDSTKGLIFYLHGNGGSLKSWGKIAKVYLDLGYDVFMLDYRGYGKSSGQIESEEQFYGDVKSVYKQLKTHYDEDAIVILGYSIGTGAATHLASKSKAKLLILQAPYYNLEDIMDQKFPILPHFLLKYKFENSKFLSQCNMPVVIFHGDQDGLIYFGSSLKLKKLFEEKDRLIVLEGFGHNGMSENQEYLDEIESILK